MSLRPSFLLSALAALVSVLLLVATPAKATPIDIDTFANSSTVSASLVSVTGNGFNSVVPDGSSGTNFTRALFEVEGAGGTSTYTMSSGISGGIANFALDKQAGSGPGSGIFANRMQWTAAPVVDLTDGGINDTIRVTFSSSPASLAGELVVSFTDSANEVASSGFLPLAGLTADNEFLMTSFTGANFDWSTVKSASLAFDNAVTTTASRNETLGVTGFQAVPEPGTIAMMATGGAALVAGFVTRRRIAAKA